MASPTSLGCRKASYDETPTPRRRNEQPGPSLSFDDFLFSLFFLLPFPSLAASCLLPSHPHTIPLQKFSVCLLNLHSSQGPRLRGEMGPWISPSYFGLDSSLSPVDQLFPRKDCNSRRGFPLDLDSLSFSKKELRKLPCTPSIALSSSTNSPSSSTTALQLSSAYC